MGRLVLRLDQINEEYEFYKDLNVYFSFVFVNGVKILKKFVGIFFLLKNKIKKFINKI